MLEHTTSDKARLRRQHTEQAIALALHHRWEEAVAANQRLLELFPSDVDAYNRLGKALTELGRYAGARRAYSKSLEIDPNNTIAQKNLTRLAHLKEETAPVVNEAAGKVDLHLFIEETGKSTQVNLRSLTPKEVWARMSAGDPVALTPQGKLLAVTNLQGELLGYIEPKLGLHLVNLMEGGNRYAAAITSLHDSGARIIIKEVYQHPSQAHRLSFPSKATDGFRPYTRDSLVRYDFDEEEEITEEGEYVSDWEEEHPAGMHEESPFLAEEVEPVEKEDDLEEI